MDDAIKQIAERLKGLREVLDLSVDEVAATVGLSPNAYEELESGLADISVSILQKISRKYGIALDVLMFGEEPKMSSYFLTRAGTGVSIERTKAYKYQSLASGFRGRIVDPFVVTVEPDDGTKPLAINAHPGQEFNLVLEGDLELTIAGKALQLHAGDSIYFNSELPHGMRAIGSRSVKFLAVIM